jgi:transposase
MAAPFSMDLRERVFKAWQASGDADDVAATFGVSRAWVHRLAQRQRETQSLAPRQQTTFRKRVLAGNEDRLAAFVAAKPDATLTELRAQLPTTAALSTLWTELDRLGLTVNKTVHASEQRRADVAAERRRWRDTQPLHDARAYSSTNRASPRTCCGAMRAVRAGRAPSITRPAAIGRRTPWWPRCGRRR